MQKVNKNETDPGGKIQIWTSNTPNDGDLWLQHFILDLSGTEINSK